MPELIMSRKDQFERLAEWEKYELIEWLEKLNRHGAVQVKVRCCQTYQGISFNRVDCIRCHSDEQIDGSYCSPLKLLNVFDGF